MLFNSYTFIFGFLPITLMGFFWLGRSSQHLAALWLAAASVFFYGWWDARYVGLLLASIAFNFGTGYLISRKLTGEHSVSVSAQLRWLLAVAIGINAT